MNKPLFTTYDWSLDGIDDMWKVIDDIGKSLYGLDYYKPSIEIISAEHMLNAYSSNAMPIMYDHWSFGKSYVESEQAFRRGEMNLAYEVVINTNPLITYLMED